MSAFAGLGITDVEVELQGPEIPILDGSSREFCRGMQCAGTQPLKKCRTFRLLEEVFLEEDGRRIRISSGSGLWRYAFTPDGRRSFSQEVVFPLTPETYVNEVAPARTFVFAEEIEEIQSVGLGLGGSEANTVVVFRTSLRATNSWM
jgi:UDP-3-O-[3-hydroxymyristoyl] N-acetylglucosamine deacetylase